MSRLLSGILTILIALTLALGVLASAPGATKMTAEAFHGYGDHYSYHYEWKYTGNRFYYYDDQYTGWKCEYALYRVWNNGYREFLGYHWEWC